MKKLLLGLLLTFNINSMTPEDSEKSWENYAKEYQHKAINGSFTDSTISKLNGAMFVPKDPVPCICKKEYGKLLIDVLKKLVEDLYTDNLIDLETMSWHLKELKTDRTAEIMDELLSHIKILKES